MTGGADVLYNKFNVDSSIPPDNPPRLSTTRNYSCVIAVAVGQWKLSRCTEPHCVVCQSIHTGSLHCVTCLFS